MRKVAIIGAGITGLVVADGLRERADVTVFEKSWGPGGRMATRRFRIEDGHAFADHGAPYVHAHTDAFAAFMQEREHVGRAARWGERDGMPAWVGLPHMNTMLTDIAERCATRFQARVDAVRREADGWHLYLAPNEREGGAETGTVGPFARAVIAVPATQAARLVESDALAPQLEPVEADPCWTWMGVFDRPLQVEALRRPTPDVEWVASSAAKPGRDGPVTLVAHATNEWSRVHLEEEAGSVERLLRDALRSVAELPEPVASTAHRWRYSTTARPLGRPFVDAGDGLFLVGDWCLGANAEDGFLSAQALLDAF